MGLAVALVTRLGRPFTIATGVLLTVAFAYRLERMLPALDRVVAVQAEDAEFPDDADVMLIDVADPATRGSTTRAYPLDRMVIARHLVPDTVRSSPVIVTYCALCRTGIAFRAEVDGRPARFRVVGVFGAQPTA